METEKNKLMLMGLLKAKGNDECADCGNREPPPDWASVSLGIFICLNCSGIHRGLNLFKSVVKSVRLDKWTDESCETMSTIGNILSNKKYEKDIPVVWERPTPNSHPALLKEWIHAKYERQEFTGENPGSQPYMNGCKKGTLHKRERRKNEWNDRWFVLCPKTHTLAYYKKKDDVEPIHTIDVRNLNVILCDEKKTGKHESMQLCESFNGKDRSYFVYSETGSDLIDWYLSIRAARLIALDLNGSRLPRTVISNVLSRPFIMEGMLEKTGPKVNDTWQKRWVSVDVHRFMYSNSAMEAYPTGVVLGPEGNGFSVREGVDGKHPAARFCFIVATPTRNFNFKANTADSMEPWMAAFKTAMEPFPSLSSCLQEKLASAENALERLSISSYVSDESTSSSCSDE